MADADQASKRVKTCAWSAGTNMHMPWFLMGMSSAGGWETHRYQSVYSTVLLGC